MIQTNSAFCPSGIDISVLMQKSTTDQQLLLETGLWNCLF